MKKLVIVATTVAMICVANAANCVWGSVAGSWETNDGSDLTEGSATLFFYLGTVTANAAGSAFDLSGATFVKSVNEFDSDNWGYGDINSEALVDLSAVESTSAGQVYSLVLVDKNVSSLDGYEGNYMILSGESAEIPIPGGTVTYYADFTSDAAVEAGGWSTMAVPEPTSGLLLLLGMAGLALKRKIA